MTYDQLRELAKRHAYVRWERSGVVEMLRMSRRGSVQAVNLLTGIEHMILRRRVSYCVEVKPTDPIPVGAFFPVRVPLQYRHHQRPKGEK